MSCADVVSRQRSCHSTMSMPWHCRSTLDLKAFMSLYHQTLQDPAGLNRHCVDRHWKLCSAPAPSDNFDLSRHTYVYLLTNKTMQQSITRRLYSHIWEFCKQQNGKNSLNIREVKTCTDDKVALVLLDTAWIPAAGRWLPPTVHNTIHPSSAAQMKTTCGHQCAQNNQCFWCYNLWWNTHNYYF